jgi:hypothetical protein
VSLVPELGPALGRLTARTSDSRSTVPLDDLRLELVSTIFEHAAAARAFGADAAAAASALNRATWLGAWETTVAAVAARLAERVERELQGAAVESRLPPRRHAALRLADADRRAIAGRLGSGSLAFLRRLDALERLVPAVSSSGARATGAISEWQEALLSVARRLESAWLAVEDAAGREPGVWTESIESVRRWRRPRWPVWTATALVLAVAGYVGLVFGGYLPAVGPVGSLARAWWYR